MNVLKPNLRISVRTLLDAGKSQHEIARVLGVNRKTIRRIAREAKSPGVATGIVAEKAADITRADQNPPPRPPARKPAAMPSACEIHREWIESQIDAAFQVSAITHFLFSSITPARASKRHWMCVRVLSASKHPRAS